MGTLAWREILDVYWIYRRETWYPSRRASRVSNGHLKLAYNEVRLHLLILRQRTIHLDMVVGRKKPLNIALILLSVLQAWIKVASAQDNRTSSNITVTRNLVLPDFFDFWSNTRNEECSVSTPTICEDYGGIAGHVDCKEICCKRCICQRQKPTFVVDKQQCVEDRNITGISGELSSCICNPQLLS